MRLTPSARSVPRSLTTTFLGLILALSLVWSGQHMAEQENMPCDTVPFPESLLLNMHPLPLQQHHPRMSPNPNAPKESE